MKRLLSFMLLMALCLIPCRRECAAVEAGWKSIGARVGANLDSHHHDLRQYEAVGIYQLPWELRSRSGWGCSTQVDLSAGMLEGKGEFGFIGTAGPSFILGRSGFPLALNFGVSVAVLSEDTFGGRDYNGLTQFVSHGGLDYRITRKVEFAYRFQHMSNAGLNGGRNPGVNMHVFGFNWYLGR